MYKGRSSDICAICTKISFNSFETFEEKSITVKKVGRHRRGPRLVVAKYSMVRLCIDYANSNKLLLRSHFPIGKVKTILSQVQGSNYFRYKFRILSNSLESRMSIFANF